MSQRNWRDPLGRFNSGGRVREFYGGARARVRLLAGGPDHAEYDLAPILTTGPRFYLRLAWQFTVGVAGWLAFSRSFFQLRGRTLAILSVLRLAVSFGSVIAPWPRSTRFARLVRRIVEAAATLVVAYLVYRVSDYPHWATSERGVDEVLDLAALVAVLLSARFRARQFEQAVDDHMQAGVRASTKQRIEQLEAAVAAVADRVDLALEMQVADLEFKKALASALEQLSSAQTAQTGQERTVAPSRSRTLSRRARDERRRQNRSSG